MIARAPGKLVLSGAYAVLEGAPALVAAVDRYVIADAGRRSDRPTPEVVAALESRGNVGQIAAPWFDASALRSGGPHDRKLGIGSSAAILVASLAAIELAREGQLDDLALQTRILGPAITAHRKAQGGGSGIDVVASTLGGIQRCILAGAELTTTTAVLPRELVIDVWTSPGSASTSLMLEQVARLRERDPVGYRAIMAALSVAAEDAAVASTPGAYVGAIRRQSDALARLGAAADAPIVTAIVAGLDALARAHDGVMMPSGAGGGDVVLWVGPGPTAPRVAAEAMLAGLAPLAVTLGARGVHAADSSGDAAR